MPAKKKSKPTRKQHDWSQFTLKIEIKVSPDKVYKAWTDERLITRWFCVNAACEPRKNGRLYFEWLGGDKLETKILAANNNRLFRFPFGRNNEKVEVKFTKVRGGTLVTLRQYSMKTTPEPKWSMHKGCETGWTFFLANLKAFLERRIDLRSHDPKKSYAQGYVNS